MRGRERRLARRNAEPQVLESSSQDSAQDRQASAHSCIAAVGTLLANFSAGPAHRAVEIGTSQQDVCAAATHFHTSHHQAEVLGLDMLAATFEAMRHRGLEAGPIASKALLDTVARLRFHRGHRDLPH